MAKVKFGFFIFAAVLISACSSNKSSGDDADLSVLDPAITFPASNATIDGETEIRVDLDSSVDYETVNLLVNGIEVAEDSSAPYSFTWNPYFVEAASDASLIVKALTEDGQILRSSATVVTIDRSAEAGLFRPLTINSDSDLQTVFPYATGEINLSWSVLDGAEAYQYRVSEGSPSNSIGTTSTITVSEGINTIEVRASQNDQWGRWVEVIAVEVSLPNPPEVTVAYDETTGRALVRTDVDSSAEYSSIALYVDGEQVASSESSEQALYWHPYYWASADSTQWWIAATLADGRVLSSSRESFNNIETGVRQLISVILPPGGPEYRDINSLNVQWGGVNAASSYEYELRSLLSNQTQTGITSESLSANFTELVPGGYEVRARAIDDNGRAGVWSDVEAFSIELPAAPSFSAPTLNSKFVDVSSVEVEWQAVNEASAYEYRIDDGAWQTTTELGAEVLTPAVGTFSVDLRSLDALSRPGIYTNLFFEILPPALPEILDPSVRWVDDSFEVTLSWEDFGDASNYLIEWDGDTQIIETAENSAVVVVPEAGAYSWRLKRINEAGHESNWVDQAEVNVGIFRTELGGTDDDRGKKLLTSKTGGYLVLASTASRELDLSVSISSSQPAPWIIKLDDSGQVSEELILPSPERVEDIFETDDGTVFLAGYDWSVKSGFVYKLNSSLELIWRKEYLAADSDERYDLTSILVRNDQLLSIGATWKTVNNVSSRDKYEILVASLESGEELSRMVIESIDDVGIYELDKLVESPSGLLVLSGTLTSDVEFYDSGPQFVAYLDDSFVVTASWVSEQYSFESIGDIEFISQNSTLFVIGQAALGSLTVASLNGSDLSQRTFMKSPEDELFYSGQRGMCGNGSNGILAISKDQSRYSEPEPITIVEYDENILEVSRQDLSDESGFVAGADIVINPDGSVTVLFNQSNDGYDDNDLVIKRFNLVPTD